MTQKESLTALLKECPFHSPETTAEFLIDMGVIVAPCKIGETLYCIDEFLAGVPSPELYSDRIESIGFEISPEGELFFIINHHTEVYPNEFGVAVFTNPEEAMTALQDAMKKKGGSGADE